MSAQDSARAEVALQITARHQQPYESVRLNRFGGSREFECSVGLRHPGIRVIAVERKHQLQRAVNVKQVINTNQQIAARSERSTNSVARQLAAIRNGQTK